MFQAVRHRCENVPGRSTEGSGNAENVWQISEIGKKMPMLR